MKIVLKGRVVCKGKAEGDALVSHDLIDFDWIDPATGMYSFRGHELDGKNLSDKILVFPGGCGATTGDYMLYLSKRFGKNPKAIINDFAYPITVVGAIISNIPMIYELERNPVEAVETGDFVMVDGDKEIVEVTKKKNDVGIRN